MNRPCVAKPCSAALSRLINPSAELFVPPCSAYGSYISHIATLILSLQSLCSRLVLVVGGNFFLNESRILACDYALHAAVVAPANDAVEKPHSENLFQLWVDFFQNKPLSSFSVSCFSKIISLQTCLIWQVYSCDTETRIPYSASLSRITMIRQLLDIMHHAVQLPLTIHFGFSA